MRALAILFLLYGCGGSSSSRSDAAIADAALSGVDQSMAPDLATTQTTAGISCGTTPCAANAQFCCTSDSGKTGMCGQGDDAATCDGSRFYCDGPEDCPPALPECCITDGVANCIDTACKSQAEGGGKLCHFSSECVGQVCCSSTETPYELCLDACP
jgi:hypothetical protein